MIGAEDQSLFRNALEVEVFEEAKARFNALPNGQPSSLEDFAAILILASMSSEGEDPDEHVVGAKVRLHSLGFGPHLAVEGARRTALYDAALSLWSPGDQGFLLPTPAHDRMAEMWGKVALRRQDLRRRVDLLRAEIGALEPPGLSLDDHQVEAILFLRDRGYLAGLGDDMGLGKTISVLMAMALCGDLAFPAVVACPATLVATWRFEIDRWLSPRSPIVYELRKGIDFSAVREEVTRRTVLLVGSWQAVARYQSDLQTLRPGFFVGDESHYLADWDSHRTQGAIRLRSACRFRVPMTGTFLPNGRHREAFAQLKFLRSDIFSHLSARGGDRGAFERRYCHPTPTRTRQGRIVLTCDGRSEPVEFGCLVQGHVLRRTKIEVYGVDGFPEKSRSLIIVPISDRDRLRLARAKDEVRSRLEARSRDLERDLLEEGRLDRDAVAREVRARVGSEAVEVMTQLRQVLGHIKASWCVSHVEDLVREGFKVLLFCAHNDVARATGTACGSALGLHRVRVASGDTAPRTRHRIIEEARDPAVQVLVLTEASCEGLTLVEFRRTVFVERYWRPAKELQGEDRSWRRGQEEDVNIGYLHCPGTIDDVMVQAMNWKERGQQQAQGAADVRLYDRAVEWVLSAGPSN